MAAQTTTPGNAPTVVSVKFGVDVKDALRGAARLQKDITKNMKTIQTGVTKADKGMGKFWKQFKGAQTKTKGLKDLKAQLKALDKVIADREKLIEAARDQVRSAKGGKAKKAALKRFKDVRRTSGYDEARSARADVKRSLGELNANVDFDADELREGAEQAGESIAAPLRELLDKDLMTKVRGMSKILAAAGSDKMKQRAEALKEFGERYGKRGAEKRAAAGGAGGKAAGFGMQAFGKLAQGLGSVLGVIAKLAPAISMLSSFMMGLIKIMLDLEAMNKEWNKQILSVSGTSNYLARSLGNTGKAAAALRTDLKLLREGGTDAAIAMGASREAAMSFQAAVIQEGVAIDKLGTAAGEAAASQRGHTKAVEMGIAYSRAFGVSLNDIAQMQGQLMSELGMSTTNVQAGFQAIAAGAAEAGIESQKFFGIVRSFSSDLTLFTLRIAELSKVMGVLGKVMDPKKMNQALQTLSSTFAEDTLENAKYVMMAGPEDTKRIQRAAGERRVAASEATLKERLLVGKDKEGKEVPKEVLAKIAEEIDAVVKAIKSPNEDTARAIAAFAQKYEKQLPSEVIGELHKTAEMRNLLQAGRVIDEAAAAKGLDLTGQYELIMAAIEKMPGMPGTVNVQTLTGEAREGLAKEIGEERYAMIQDLERGLMQVQERLIQRVTEGTATPEDTAMLERMGVQRETKDETLKALTKLIRGNKTKGLVATLKAMDESSKKAIEDSNKQRDFQAETSSFQKSILERVSDLSENYMQKLANWLEDIFLMVEKIFLSLPKWFMGEDKLKAAQDYAAKTKLPEVIEAFKGAKDVNVGSDKLIATMGKEVIEGVQAALKERAELEKRMKTETDPEKKKEMYSRMRELNAVSKFGKMTKQSLEMTQYTQGANAMIHQVVEAKKVLGQVNRKKKEAAPAADPAAGTAVAAAPAATAPAAPTAPNAMGGTVTGIMNGMAQVRRFPAPAPGEGWASVGRGEKITPAGGGGGGGGVKVQLELKGDFRRFIQARVVEGSASHDRNKRLR